MVKFLTLSEPRFHIRLFKIGKWTIANAHFEVLIPGTTDHQVLSWELAEQFVVGDFIRSGMLDAQSSVSTTDLINPSPFKAIPSIIYNGLPVELRALIGGPLGDVTEDVPMVTDGHATILDVARRGEYQPGTYVQDFVINFGQVIPKPFCSSGPGDYIYVTGPVRLGQTVQTSADGEYEMTFEAHGELSVTPVNPLTGEPVGPTLPAFVSERHASQMSNHGLSASSLRFLRIGSAGVPGSGLLFVRLCVGPRRSYGYDAIIRCDGGEAASVQEATGNMHDPGVNASHSG